MYFDPDESVRLGSGMTCILLGAEGVHLFLQNRRGRLYAGYIDTTEDPELEEQLKRTANYEIPDEALDSLEPIDEFSKSCGGDVLQAYGAQNRIVVDQPN